MALAENEIAQVRAATDIVALIGEHVALRKVGRRWSGLCPFHTEKTPSFSVNAEEGWYHCFGCQASGDAITFVRQTQHLDFLDAVRLLADRAGVTLHEDAHQGAQRRERQEFLDAMAKAVAWYHERLLSAPDARPARDYLRSRGIDGDLARRFQLGWAPDQWDALSTSLNLSAKVLEGTGLGFVNSVGRRQDFLRARVVFPIFDPGGRAIAVGGRILPGQDERRDGRVEAKYKNSPETPIYSKRRTLYGLNWAKEDVVRSGEIVVCEGYTDVIAFFAAGLPRAVATCGTALGEEHFTTMRNFAKRVVLAYDADSAGQSAAASVYQWEKRHEVDVAVARLPGGSDPAELAQKDPEALRQAVEGAVPFLAFRLERALEHANLATAEGRARGAEAALAVLAEHPSDLVRDQYLMEVADRLRLEVGALRPRLADLVSGASRPSPPRPSAPDTPTEPGAPSPPPRALRPPSATPRPGLEALRLLLNRRSDVEGRLDVALFVDEDQRFAYEALRRGGPLPEVVGALEAADQPAAAAIVSELAVVEPALDADLDVGSVVAQLIRAAAQRELRAVEREMRVGEITPDVALATVRDVKERLEALGGPDAGSAEADLREWLSARREPR
jgi:DNA primase